MGEMTYNKLSGWVKVDGVRVGIERKNGRVLRAPAGTFKGLPSFRMIPEELWIWETETAIAPVGDIVHLNGDPFDNRWRNLRDSDGLVVEAKDDGVFDRSRFEYVFSYNSVTGCVIDNMRGNPITMVDDRPVVFFAGEWFAAEDVAWFLGTGVWPERGIRIVNGEFCDLRLANLRRIV